MNILRTSKITQKLTNYNLFCILIFCFTKIMNFNNQCECNKTNDGYLHCKVKYHKCICPCNRCLSKLHQCVCDIIINSADLETSNFVCMFLGQHKCICDYLEINNKAIEICLNDQHKCICKVLTKLNLSKSLCKFEGNHDCICLEKNKNKIENCLHQNHKCLCSLLHCSSLSYQYNADCPIKTEHECICKGLSYFNKSTSLCQKTNGHSYICKDLIYPEKSTSLCQLTNDCSATSKDLSFPEKPTFLCQNLCGHDCVCLSSRSKINRNCKSIRHRCVCFINQNLCLSDNHNCSCNSNKFCVSTNNASKCKKESIDVLVKQIKKHVDIGGVLIEKEPEKRIGVNFYLN
jgi:hypothetical protein